MKSTLSPFIVAGKTFNRLAASRLLLSSQVKAANPNAWLAMRARQALYVASALVIVPAVLNYSINGTVTPEDTRFGEIKLPNGDKFDMAKWTLIRRGLRITGAQSVLEGQVLPRMRGELPQTPGETAKQGLKDVLRGVASPYAGPLPNAAAMVLTGKTALGYEARQAGEEFPYGKAAARQLNPLLGAGMTDMPAGQSYKQRAEQIIGVSQTKEERVVRQAAFAYLYKIGKSKQLEQDFEPSEYKPLVNALATGDEETAKKQYEKIYEQRLANHEYDYNTKTGAKLTQEEKEREAKMDLQKYFERYAKKPATRSEATEKGFVEQLTPHQKELYDKVQEQQKAVAEAFFKLQPKLGKKNAGFGSLSW